MAKIGRGTRRDAYATNRAPRRVSRSASWRRHVSSRSLPARPRPRLVVIPGFGGRACTAGGQGLEAGEVVELRDSRGTVLGQGLWDPTLAPRRAGVCADADAAARRGSHRQRDRARDRPPRAAGARSAKRPRTGSATAKAIACRASSSIATAMSRCFGSTEMRSRVGSMSLPTDCGPSCRRKESARSGTGSRDANRRCDSSRFGASLRRPRSTIRENGMAMVVDLAHGQKTGAFLDQRENRERVRDLAQGRRVLNLFSYAGGFSIAAALGGASRRRRSTSRRPRTRPPSCRCAPTTSIPAAHAFVTADAFAFLEERQGETRHLGPHRQRSAELRPQREGATSRPHGLPQAPRRLRRGARAGRDLLRGVVLEPRHRGGLRRDARRRHARPRAIFRWSGSSARPRITRSSRRGPRVSTSSSRCVSSSADSTERRLERQRDRGRWLRQEEAWARS